MKPKTILTILFSMVALFCIAQTEDKQKLATVNSCDGIDIYMDCKPVSDYEILGEIEQKWWTHWTDCRVKMAKRAKENYSKADAIIILFLSATKPAKAEVIQYKK